MTVVEINTLKELQAEVGTENIGRALFKSTRCGIVFNVIEDGVSVCGYAEGADAECVPIDLKYPFASDVFWNAVERADDEGCELWAEWNEGEDE
jgi:hypothetical protein